MIYEAEKIAATLKAAREKKGLSQRALSARSGVPQSHISKIENSGVNLKIASLAAIANALDLEIALVPRKALPAVKSITRTIDDVPRVNPDTRKELARMAKQIDSLKGLDIDTTALGSLQRHFREMQQFQNLLKDTDALRSIRKSLKVVEDAGGIKALQQAEMEMANLRNALAHANISEDMVRLPRPAYRLDGDDDA